jgi:hypothetical protein
MADPDALRDQVARRYLTKDPAVLERYRRKAAALRARYPDDVGDDLLVELAEPWEEPVGGTDRGAPLTGIKAQSRRAEEWADTTATTVRQALVFFGGSMSVREAAQPAREGAKADLPGLRRQVGESLRSTPGAEAAQRKLLRGEELTKNDEDALFLLDYKLSGPKAARARRFEAVQEAEAKEQVGNAALARLRDALERKDSASRKVFAAGERRKLETCTFHTLPGSSTAAAACGAALPGKVRAMAGEAPDATAVRTKLRENVLRVFRTFSVQVQNDPRLHCFNIDELVPALKAQEKCAVTKCLRRVKWPYADFPYDQFTPADIALAYRWQTAYTQFCQLLAVEEMLTVEHMALLLGSAEFLRPMPPPEKPRSRLAWFTTVNGVFCVVAVFAIFVAIAVMLNSAWSLFARFDEGSRADLLVKFAQEQTQQGVDLFKALGGHIEVAAQTATELVPAVRAEDPGFFEKAAQAIAGLFSPGAEAAAANAAMEAASAKLQALQQLIAAPRNVTQAVSDAALQRAAAGAFPTFQNLVLTHLNFMWAGSAAQRVVALVGDSGLVQPVLTTVQSLFGEDSVMQFTVKATGLMTTLGGYGAALAWRHKQSRTVRDLSQGTAFNAAAGAATTLTGGLLSYFTGGIVTGVPGAEYLTRSLAALIAAKVYVSMGKDMFVVMGRAFRDAALVGWQSHPGVILDTVAVGAATIMLERLLAGNMCRLVGRTAGGPCQNIVWLGATLLKVSSIAALTFGMATSLTAAFRPGGPDTPYDFRLDDFRDGAALERAAEAAPLGAQLVADVLREIPDWPKETVEALAAASVRGTQAMLDSLHIDDAFIAEVWQGMRQFADTVPERLAGMATAVPFLGAPPS